MKALNMLLMMLLVLGVVGMAIKDAFAETRTLTTMLIITIKAPETQSADAPKGLEELYNVALAQSQGERIVKVEDPQYMPSGLKTYTMTERL